MTIRSPFFYVGDKYKLMPQLKKLFPQNIKTYFEPFVGGGSSMLNTEANDYCLNDIDKNVISLHLFLIEYSKKKNDFFSNIFSLIKKYNLSCSFLYDIVPASMKEKYPKTYFAHFNHDSYQKMKNDYNNNKDPFLLYLLLIYGFNHMIRFNSQGKFNLPVGNVDFNKNVKLALDGYFSFFEKKKVSFSCLDYKIFIKKQIFQEGDFVYFDPPYLISMSEYNSLWNEKKEKELYLLLDSLNAQGVKWGITNLVFHKGKSNEIFNEWCKKYNVFPIRSNYISFNDNSIKEKSKEVYVTNYGKINI